MQVLISRKTMEDIFDMSASSVYRTTRKSGFPEPIRIDGKVRWFRDEVLEWTRSQPRQARAARYLAGETLVVPPDVMFVEAG